MARETRIINKFGVMTGWNSITANVMGRDLEGISALAYSDSETKENVYGSGKYPVGRSRGNYEPTASFTLYKEEVDALKKSLSAGKRLQDIAPFDINVEYAREDGTITRDVIRNAEFTNDGVEVAQGDGTIATAYTLIVSHIDWNV
ncbi:hypothetical protein [Sphingobacterium spiritivorum]